MNTYTFCSNQFLCAFLQLKNWSGLKILKLWLHTQQKLIRTYGINLYDQLTMIHTVKFDVFTQSVYNLRSHLLVFNHFTPDLVPGNLEQTSDLLLFCFISQLSKLQELLYCHQRKLRVNEKCHPNSVCDIRMLKIDGDGCSQKTHANS